MLDCRGPEERNSPDALNAPLHRFRLIKAWLGAFAATCLEVSVSMAQQPTQGTEVPRNKPTTIWERTWDDPVAFYTFVLGIFTALLAVVSAIQIGFLIEANKTARRAAEAADLSARAAIGIELPIVRALIQDIEHLDEPIVEGKGYATALSHGAPQQYSAVSDIHFMNYGRSLGFATHLELGWRVARTLPEVPKYNKTIILPHGSIIRPQEHLFIVEVHTTLELTKREQQKSQTGESALWLFGSLHYRDFLDRKHEARFCWRRCRREDDTHYFDSDGDPPTEYTRQI